MQLENVADGGSRHAMTEIGQRPFDSRVAPTTVLSRQAHDQVGDLFQGFPAERLAVGRESSTLVVSEPEPLPAELFLEAPVLLAQIFNRRLLVLVDPASEDRDEELPWL